MHSESIEERKGGYEKPGALDVRFVPVKHQDETLKRALSYAQRCFPPSCGDALHTYDLA